MKNKVLSLVLGVSITALGATAFADPDVTGTPISTLELSSGFMPDPVKVDVQAGGPEAVTLPGCAGHITASNPDVNLTYTASGGSLNIYVKSGADTTLVINGPDGTWLCSDDANGENPAVLIPSPQSGVYNIWIGGYEAGAITPSELNISEGAPQW